MNNSADDHMAEGHWEPDAISRAVLDGMGEGFILLDGEYRIVEINAEALRLDGRQREEIVGRHVLEVWPDTERQPAWPAYQKAIAENTPVAVEYRHVTDKRDMWLEVRAYPTDVGLAVFYRDITASRAAAEHARESETRFFQIASVITKVFYIQEAGEDRLSYVSPAYEQVWEEPVEAVLADARSYMRPVHPDDRTAVLEAFERQHAGERTDLLYRLVFGERVKWINDRSYPVTDPETGVLRIFGVAEDITSRREAELERDRAAALLRTFIQAVPGVVYAKDREGRMLVANRGTAELVGKPLAEIVGRSDAEFLDDAAQAAAVMANDRRIMDAGAFEQLEEEVSFPDGSHATWLSTKGPLRGDGGEIIGLIGSSVDITERKRAEAALAESEQRFRFALEAADGIGTWDWDIRTDIIRANAQFATMYGLDPDRAAAGLPLEEYVNGIHPDDRAEVGRLIDEAVTTGSDYRAEYRLLTADGHHRWVIARGRCLRGEDGQPERFPGVTFDITDRREAEGRLRFLGTLDETLRNAPDAPAAMAAVGQLLGRHLGASRCAYAAVDADNDTFTIFADYTAPDVASSAGTYSLDLFGPRAAANMRQGQTLVIRDVGGELGADDGRETFHAIAIDAIICCPLVRDGRLVAMMAVHQDRPRDWTADEVSLVQTAVERCWAHVERVGAEARLRASEERLRLATEAAEIGFWDVDLVNDQLIWPARVKAMFGISPDVPVTMGDFYEGLHPDDREATGAAFAAAADPARRALYDVEYRTVGKEDGIVRWVAAKGRGVFDGSGRCVRVVGTARDITERRKVDDALRSSEERYRSLFEAIDAGFCILEVKFDEADKPVDYRFAEVNPAFERQTGMTDAAGRWMTEMVPDIEQHWIDTYGDVLRSGRAVRFENEAEALGRWFDVHAFPAGTPEQPRVAVLFNDITERRRAEQALRDLNATLETRIADAIAEREKVEEALRQSQKMEAVGQLTGGIAHDFNNLLTVVTGNIDMASRGLATAGMAEGRVRRSLDNAMKGAERAAALTQRLLAFSRRQPLDPKPLNVDRLVADMSDLLNRALGETVRLEVVTSPGLWRVEADPNQLESAILNLAVNARDAMPGGGTLTVETANARLDEAYAAEHAEVAPGHYVVVAVTDTGEGMSRETAARVFEPFFTTKEVGRGTGLGLSQVYGFTKQSGGHVKIYSEEGQGTTVKIYLPRILSDQQGEDEPAPAEPASRDLSRGRETIMVVEDDDDVRAYTVDCLRELGYQVLEAHDGPSALRLLERQEEPIDLLFTDVVMPGMTGRELADAAREMQADLKVLYTSGYTRNAIVHGGRLDEGVEMISKPFTYQVLGEKIADVLDIGRTGRLLLVEDDPTVRMFAAEALAGAGYAVDEAASSAEALSRMRAARGRYDAVVLDVRLPDRAGDSLAAELRAMHLDMPILVASGEHAADLSRRFAGDRCTAVIPKPYNAAGLTKTLEELGLTCRAS